MIEPRQPYSELNRLPARRSYGSYPPPAWSNIDALEADALPAEESSKLAGYAAVLFYRKYTLLILVLLGGALGFMLAMNEEPMYRAHAVLEVQSLNGRFLNLEAFDPTASSNPHGTESYLKTQLHVLESDRLLRRVLDKVTHSDSASQRSVKALGIAEADLGESSQEAVLEAVRDKLSVEAVEQTRLIELAFRSNDPRFAADFANVWADEFISSDSEAHQQSMERTGRWLAQEMDGLKAKLETSENQLQAYAQEADLLFNGKEENVQNDRLSQTQTELTISQSHRIAKQAQYEQVAKANPDSLPEVLNDPALKEYRSRLAMLRQQVAELLSTLTPTHYKVKRVQAQITELESERLAYRDDILRRIRNEYEAAARREYLVGRSYVTQTKKLSDQSAKTIRYNMLKREVDTNRHLYESMLQKVKEADVVSAVQATNIRVVDPAWPPSHPDTPQLPMSAGLGAMGGLSLGLLLVFWQERAGKSFSESGEVAAYLKVPELGAIPARREGRRFIFGRSSSQHSNLSISSGRDELNGSLALTSNEPSPDLECYRAVMTSILCAGWDTSSGSCIVVTSPGVSEGKTTTTANLGIALARTGRRTLLVDGDVRRPTLHALFGLANTSGLRNLLAEHKLEDLDSRIQSTGVPNLFLLPSGGIPREELHLLDSPRLPELLNQLKGEFDIILIDTPPMLHIADARMLARLSHGVILVVRAGRTSRQAAQAACQRFANDSTELIGVVLNDWKPERRGGYGYEDYQSRYFDITPDQHS